MMPLVEKFVGGVAGCIHLFARSKYGLSSSLLLFVLILHIILLWPFKGMQYNAVHCLCWHEVCTTLFGLKVSNLGLR
jgi:hypothetical protein